MDNKLKNGIFFVLIANMINVFFSLATNFLLPKYLSVDSYAAIKTFQLYISYVGLLHFGYVDGMYLRYGGKELGKNLNKSFSVNISTMRIFQMFVVILTIVFAVICQDYIVLCFALSIFPLNMNNYFKFLYQATGEFKLYGKIMNITTISTFVINMIWLFVLRTDKHFMYIIAYVVLYFVIWMILEINFCKKHTLEKCERFSGRELFANIKDGFLLTLGNLASMFLTSMDRWFVKILMTTVAFAQYSFAVSVENFLNLAITPITTTLYNFFCREAAYEKHKKILRYVLIFATLLPSAAFPIKLILEIFLQKYIDSVSIVFILFAAQMFYIIIKSIYVNLYKVQRKQKIYFSKLVAIIILGFLLNVIFYNIVQLKETFAVGTLISSIIWFFISGMDFKYLEITYKEYLYLFAELFAFLVCGLTFNSLIGFVLYLIISICMLFICMNSTVREIINIGKRKIMKRG